VIPHPEPSVRIASEPPQGLVTISPQQGIVVCEISVHDVADQFEVREALEVFVLRHLAGRLTPDQVAQLRENLDRQRQTILAGDVPGNIELDSAFHLLLCRFHGNREFVRAMEGLRDKIHRMIVQVLTRNPGRLEQGFEEHVRIVETLIRGDPEGGTHDPQAPGGRKGDPPVAPRELNRS
jgi:DNA-binding GntR family transcriptional regulator